MKLYFIFIYGIDYSMHYFITLYNNFSPTFIIVGKGYKLLKIEMNLFTYI